METKICDCCGKNLPIEQFPLLAHFGHSNTCAACTYGDMGKMRHKRCKCCGKMLPLSEFALHYMSSDGHVATCNSCREAQNQVKESVSATTQTDKTLNIPIPFTEMSDVELMAELRRRGFRGELVLEKLFTI